MKSKQTKTIVLIGMLFSFCLITATACSLLSSIMGPSSMTPKQQAIVWLNTYNNIYDDTMAMATNPSITPAQKELVIKKKEILTEVWPLLKAYTAIIDNGGTPAQETTMQLTDLINRLTILAGGA